jgi:hypothetical protein
MMQITGIMIYAVAVGPIAETKSTELGPSLDASNRSLAQHFPNVLWNSEGHYRGTP